MKRHVLISFLSIVSLLGFGQHDWSFNSESFQYSHQIVGKAWVQGQIVNGLNIEIGAFCGDECRGTAKTVGGSCTYSTFPLTMYSNLSDGEIMHFVLRDTDNNEYELINNVIFENGAVTCELGNPFLWMDEWLYKSTDFFVFNLSEGGQDGQINTDDNTVSIYFPDEVNFQAVTPFFVQAPGAKVFIGGIEQISQESIIDLSSPVIYTVYGVDGEQTDWTVSANILSGIRQSEFENKIDVYPTVSYDGNVIVENDKIYSFNIFKIDGTLLKSGITKNGITGIYIDSAGVYIIKFSLNNNLVYSTRLIIAK